MNADQLLAEWAAKEFGCKPEDFIGVEFGTYIGCYSEYTHDYGVESAFSFMKDGKVHRQVREWGLPDIIYQMAEYKEAEDKVAEDHERLCYHRGEDTGEW